MTALLHYTCQHLQNIYRLRHWYPH